MKNNKIKLMVIILSMGLIFGACSNNKANTSSNSVSDKVVVDKNSNKSNMPKDQKLDKNDQGMVEEGSFASEKLKLTWKYKVYLPQGYDKNSDEKYPVLYMLHGMGENSGSILEKSDSKNILDYIMKDKDKMLVVYVDGFSSFYVDSEYDKMMETAIVDELISHIDQTYKTSNDAKDRAIGGVSVGGYGAARLSLKHPDLFSKAMLISPTVWKNLDKDSLIRRNYRAFSDGKEIWSDDIYKKNLPTNFIDDNSKKVSFYIEANENDKTIAIGDIEKFAKDLENNKVKVELKKDKSDKDHNWEYWKGVIKDGYAWTLDQFK